MLQLWTTLQDASPYSTKPSFPSVSAPCRALCFGAHGTQGLSQRPGGCDVVSLLSFTGDTPGLVLFTPVNQAFCLRRAMRHWGSRTVCESSKCVIRGKCSAPSLFQELGEELQAAQEQSAWPSESTTSLQSSAAPGPCLISLLTWLPFAASRRLDVWSAPYSSLRDFFLCSCMQSENQCFLPEADPIECL